MMPTRRCGELGTDGVPRLCEPCFGDGECLKIFLTPFSDLTPFLRPDTFSVPFLFPNACGHAERMVMRMRIGKQHCRGQLRVLVLALVAAAATGACHMLSPDDVMTNDRSGVPIYWAYRADARPPGEGEYEIDTASGLLYAVWADGQIVRAATEELVGVSYDDGMLNELQLSELLAAIQRSGLSDPPESRMIVDFALGYRHYLPQDVAHGVYERDLTSLSELRALVMSVDFERRYHIDGDVPQNPSWR